MRVYLMHVLSMKLFRRKEALASLQGRIPNRLNGIWSGQTFLKIIKMFKRWKEKTERLCKWHFSAFLKLTGLLVSLRSGSSFHSLGKKKNGSLFTWSVRANAPEAVAQRLAHPISFHMFESRTSVIILTKSLKATESRDFRPLL